MSAARAVDIPPPDLNDPCCGPHPDRPSGQTGKFRGLTSGFHDITICLNIGMPAAQTGLFPVPLFRFITMNNILRRDPIRPLISRSFSSPPMHVSYHGIHSNWLLQDGSSRHAVYLESGRRLEYMYSSRLVGRQFHKEFLRDLLCFIAALGYGPR